MSLAPSFQAVTRGVFSEKNFAQTLYDEQIERFNEQTSVQAPPAALFPISSLLYGAFRQAITYSLPIPQEIEFPQPELPCMVEVNDTAFTNVVPVGAPAEEAMKVTSGTQYITIPVQLEQIAAQAQRTRKISPSTELYACKFERPPSAADARALNKQVEGVKFRQKQDKLDVDALTATRRSDILKQLNDAAKQGKKIVDLPESQYIIIDESGRVLGVAHEGGKNQAQQIGGVDVRQVKKDQPSKKKEEKAPNAVVQKKKEQEQVFIDLGRKYEETLLKTGVVSSPRK